jgi:dephospho-CoA kinase
VKLVGITGSICSGKTTVGGMFGSLGAAVINADTLTHRLYGTDTGLQKKIVAAFGEGVRKGGRIDRKRLAEKAFENRRQLSKLCRIVHPRVMREIRRIAGRSGSPVVVVDAPLLIESRFHEYVDIVVLVKSAVRIEAKRCAYRGLTRRDVRTRRAAQMPFKKKTRYADYVIDNRGSRKMTKREVARVWNEIR